MAGQQISVKQGVMMMAMYILGTTFLVSSGIEAGQDIWIAYLISLGLSLVLVCMYARMMSHMPGKDFFTIMETLLGRPLTVIFLIIMSVYLFQHLSYVLRHFSEYINVAGLPGTPLVASLISMGLLCALGVIYGIEVLGKWSEWFLLFVAAFIILAALLLTREMHIDYLRPILQNGFAPIAKGVWALISFPFGQLVAFLFILPPARTKREPYRIFILGLLIGGALIFVSSMSNVLVLGVKGVARLFYPTYSTLAIIRIGTFIQRLEIAATTIFMITVFVKAAVLLLGLIRSLARILKLKSYTFIVIPVMLLAINYGFNAYRGNLEHYTGIAVFVPYFTTFYQIIIPFLIFMLLEWSAARRRRGKVRDVRE
mgnify:CR=1 FL=1